jgi:hypothetical protein
MHDLDQNYLLEGVITMDEAYLGASKHGKKRGRGTERTKMAVAVPQKRKRLSAVSPASDNPRC